MIRFTRPFINGRWVSDGIAHKLINPYTRTAIDITQSTVAQINDAVDVAQNASKSWADWSTRGRSIILQKLSSQIKTHFDELAFLESQAGKPISQAKEDIQASIEIFDYFADLANSVGGSTFKDSYTVKKPVGVVGLITSFNYPFLIMAWKVAPALAAGNAIIVKPALATPLSTLLFAHITTKVGLPDGIFNVLLGGNEIGRALVRHKNVNLVSFTGSTTIGKEVAIACASQIKPAILELGGNNAAVVFADADLDETARLVLDANMGQNCCAISRLLLHEDIHDLFIAKLIERSNSLILGDPALPSTQFGTLIDEQVAYKIRKLTVDAVDRGNTKVDLKLKSDHSAVVVPTIFLNVSDADILATTEIFGPVLSILKPFKTTQGAIDRVNDSDHGLACGIFTKNNAISSVMIDNVQAGILWVNSYNILPPWLPFGGLKQSGQGKELGLESLNNFMITKSVFFPK